MFQIIFTPTSAAELARMPKNCNCKSSANSAASPAGAQHRTGRVWQTGTGRADVASVPRGDYRVYFERHELACSSTAFSAATRSRFLFRSGLKTGEDEALQEIQNFGIDRIGKNVRQRVKAGKLLRW